MCRLQQTLMLCKHLVSLLSLILINQSFNYVNQLARYSNSFRIGNCFIGLSNKAKYERRKAF